MDMVKLWLERKRVSEANIILVFAAIDLRLLSFAQHHQVTNSEQQICNLMHLFSLLAQQTALVPFKTVSLIGKFALKLLANSVER